jgi:hypothetical protein
MALQQPSVTHATRDDVIRILVIMATVVAVVVIATAMFGMSSGPAFDITPDPARLSGLPF